MPGGDGTGPGGLGPRTGRGLGYCAGYSTPGFTKGPGMGMGWGRGMGRGRGIGYGRGMAWGRGGWGGWGRSFSPVAYSAYPASVPVFNPYATPQSEAEILAQEREYLETQLESMKGALENLNKRLSDLQQTKQQE